MTKKRILFIDRDGTLIKEPELDFQVDSLEKLEFIPGVFRNMYLLRKFTDYLFVLVSNQDGMGTESFPAETFHPAHNKCLQAFWNEGVVFDAEHIDPSMPEDNSPNRKPGTGMLTAYFSAEYDLENSFVIGDRLTDVELAKNLGARAILLGDQERLKEMEKSDLSGHCALLASNWDEIYSFIRSSQRKARITRKTSETSILVELSLDGKGRSEINTGLGFFDHMLEQIARHGNVDLTVKVEGDLHVDEHHTIEDTGLALGEAFLQALGSKQGINRYGFLLPMDDCLAQAAIDFGGRPWLVWEAAFFREKVGDVPTEMFYHFFKSFSDAAKCNLNLKAEGTNEHHKIEAIFKAFSKALRQAVELDTGSDQLPSTKGIL